MVKASGMRAAEIFRRSLSRIPASAAGNPKETRYAFRGGRSEGRGEKEMFRSTGCRGGNVDSIHSTNGKKEDPVTGAGSTLIRVYKLVGRLPLCFASLIPEQ